MTFKQDFFISHAGADKAEYIQPLATCLSERRVTYWLDSHEVKWGDPVSLKINEGLRDSRHVVLCLSSNFITRPWAEDELNAALARSIEVGDRKVLPLILNCKEQVLLRYPLLAGRAYREFSAPEIIADELAQIATSSVIPDDHIRVVIESVHSGLVSDVYVPQHATVEWLANKVRQRVGLKESLETGGYQSFEIRWALVDVEAEHNWKKMKKNIRERIYMLVRTSNDIQVVRNRRKRLSDIGVGNNTKFHLYAVEDIITKSRSSDDDSGGKFGGGGGVCYKK